MTAKEMQIEFERLVQLSNPQLESVTKLDSDTIFYFINSAQERYIKQSFIKVDGVDKNSNSYNRLLDICKSLITTTLLYDGYNSTLYKYCKSFELPNDINNKFYVYLSSFSDIVDKVDNESKIANNELISATDISKILVTNINKPILRNPCAVLNSLDDKSSITIYYDTYTTLTNCTITYIRKPLDINTISGNGITSVCELDSNVHRELVEMAVDIFMAEGPYRLSLMRNKEKDKNETKSDNQ